MAIWNDFVKKAAGGVNEPGGWAMAPVAHNIRYVPISQGEQAPGVGDGGRVVGWKDTNIIPPGKPGMKIQIGDNVMTPQGGWGNEEYDKFYDFLKRMAKPAIGAYNVQKGVRDWVGRKITGAVGSIGGYFDRYADAVGRGALPVPDVDRSYIDYMADPSSMHRDTAAAAEASKDILNGAKIGWQAGDDPVNSEYAWNRVGLSTGNILRHTIPGFVGLFNEDAGKAVGSAVDRTPLSWLSKYEEKKIYGDESGKDPGLLDRYLRRNYGDNEVDDYYRSLIEGEPSGQIHDDLDKSNLAISYSEIPLGFGVGGAMLGPVLKPVGKLGGLIRGAKPGVARTVASYAPEAGMQWMMFGHPWIRQRAALAKSREDRRKSEEARDKFRAEHKEELDEANRIRNTLNDPEKRKRIDWLKSEINRPGPFTGIHKLPYILEYLDHVDPMKARELRKQLGMPIDEWYDALPIGFGLAQ